MAQVAETTVETGRRDDAGPRNLRLVLRRTRLTGPQRELWPNWRDHAFITDRADTAVADAYHRAHARVEFAIKDLKACDLRHCPSGRFFANSTWLACAVLAHNIMRWTARLGHTSTPTDSSPPPPRSATGLLTIPGRLVNNSRRHILRLPARWPWAHTFTTALTRIRSLPRLI